MEKKMRCWCLKKPCNSETGTQSRSDGKSVTDEEKLWKNKESS
jgi:hypothetical protein